MSVLSWLEYHCSPADMDSTYRGEGADELNQENDKASKGCGIHHKHSNLCSIQSSLKNPNRCQELALVDMQQHTRVS